MSMDVLHRSSTVIETRWERVMLAIGAQSVAEVHDYCDRAAQGYGLGPAEVWWQGGFEDGHASAVDVHDRRDGFCSGILHAEHVQLDLVAVLGIDVDFALLDFGLVLVSRTVLWNPLVPADTVSSGRV